MPKTKSNFLKEKLLITNPDYNSALKSGRSTRFIDKTIPLFSKEIRTRRGNKLDQMAIMKQEEVFVPQGVRYFYGQYTDSYATHSSVYLPKISGNLREEQVTIIDKLLKHRYAYGHISTGLGKTWILLEIASRLQKKTLIVVDTTSSLTQMTSQIKTILGITPRVPNKKKNLDSPITVYNIHSLNKLDLQSFGLVLYDEADKYLASPNFRHTLNQIDSEYAYAVTGTIKVNGHPDNILSIYYGAKEELIMKHMTPSYIQVPSKFQEYSFEHFADLANKLYQNEERNDFIVSTTHACMQSHHKAIVFTRQIEHAKLLQEKFQALGYHTYMLIGEVPQDEREAIRNSLISYPGKCILIGSVLLCGRGFDAPPLDLAVLTSAEKFESNIFQFIGRIIRKYETKTKCTFIDITDPLNYIFKSQAKERLQTFKKAFPNIN